MYRLYNNFTSYIGFGLSNEYSEVEENVFVFSHLNYNKVTKKYRLMSGDEYCYVDASTIQFEFMDKSIFFVVPLFYYSSRYGIIEQGVHIFDEEYKEHKIVQSDFILNRDTNITLHNGKVYKGQRCSLYKFSHNDFYLSFLQCIGYNVVVGYNTSALAVKVASYSQSRDIILNGLDINEIINTPEKFNNIKYMFADNIRPVKRRLCRFEDTYRSGAVVKFRKGFVVVEKMAQCCFDNSELGELRDFILVSKYKEQEVLMSFCKDFEVFLMGESISEHIMLRINDKICSHFHSEGTKVPRITYLKKIVRMYTHRFRYGYQERIQIEHANFLAYLIFLKTNFNFNIYE